MVQNGPRWQSWKNKEEEEILLVRKNEERAQFHLRRKTRFTVGGRQAATQKLTAKKGPVTA
jgi:hypothetical protein